MKPANTSPEHENKSGKSKKSGNIFDSYIRQILSQMSIFADFLLHYADPKILQYLDLSHIELFPTHSFDRHGKERISDLMFLCGVKGCNGLLGVIVIFEHAGHSIFYLPKRLLQYLVGAWNIIADNEKEKIPLPFPYFIVIRTGKKSKKEDEEQSTTRKQKISDMCVQVPGLAEAAGFDFDYTNVVLADYELDKLSGNPVTQAALGALKVLTEGKPELFSQALMPIAQLDDFEKKWSIVQLTLILYTNYSRARDRKVDEAEIDRILDPIFNQEEKENMITTIFEDKYMEGYVDGEAKSEVKWKAEGIATVLKTRFGNVPTQIVELINSYSDPIVLESWLGLAATCKSLAEFEAALK
jgi:hypothetical protein